MAARCGVARQKEDLWLDPDTRAARRADALGVRFVGSEREPVSSL